MRPIGATTHRYVVRARTLGASCLALLALGALTSAPALAHAPAVTEDSLSIVEGESTHPNQSIESIWASTNSSAQVVLSIVHGGVEVATNSESHSTWLSHVPEVGDDVILEVGGTLIASITYDGLPSIEADVCAGSENFSGQRTAGTEVEGGEYSFKAFPTTEQEPTQLAQVTALSGASFGGNFLKPLALGETVLARESSKTTLGSGAIFNYSSENQRPVAACPAPPAPPPAPPVVVLPPLNGLILKLAHASIRNLLKSGWLTVVDINEPGTVTEDLYADNGTLPAHASAVSKAKHHKSPPALLIARGVGSATAAGTVNVLLHPTGKGRFLLKHTRKIKAVLITTLRNANGSLLNLGRRTVTFSG
jgi:hypothetical protein